jgi:hypothetical protein
MSKATCGTLEHMRFFASHHTPLVRGLSLGVLMVGVFFVFQPVAHAEGLEDLATCLGNMGNCIPNIVAGFLKLVVGLFASILGLVGAFFNVAMIYTVFNFSLYFGNSEGLLLAWTVIRDLANIVLLFSFVYIGIRTILGTGNYSVGKTLPALLIFAVLLNFSLFIAEAVVDVSNAVASSFYTQASGADCRDASNMDACANEGVAGKIMEITGISGFLSERTWSTGSNVPQNGPTALVLYFCILMFLIVVIGTLFAASLMLISRAVTLIYVFVTAPLGLAGAAIEPLKKFSEDWWKQLSDNALFAPVMVLLILVGLKIMEGLKNSFVGADQTLLALLEQPSGGESISLGGIFVLFALVIGFFWGALISAKRFSVFGASAVVGGAQKWIGNTAGGFSVYPAAGLVSGIAGGAGKVYNAGARFARRNTPAPLRTAASLLGGSAIDDGIRGTLSGVRKGAGGMKIPGTNMRSYDELQKARKERRDEMKNLDKDQRGKTLAQNMKSERQKENEKEEKDRKEYFKQRKEHEKDEGELQSTTPATVAAAAQRMGSQRVEEYLKDSNKNLSLIAKNVSPDMFDKLINSKEIAESRRNELIAKRFEDIGTAITNNRAADIKAYSSKDLEILAKVDPRMFTELITKLDGHKNLYSGDQYESLLKSSALSNSQRNELKENGIVRRTEQVAEDHATPIAVVQPLVLSLKSKQKAELSDAALQHPGTIRILTQQDLGAIMAKDKDDATIRAIATAVRDRTHPNHAAIMNYFTRVGAADAYFQP